VSWEFVSHAGDAIEMRRFSCPTCGAAVFFDDLECVVCASGLAYDLEPDLMVAAATASTCGARAVSACNWTVTRGSPWCRACGLDLVPGQGAGSIEHRVFQRAKRRVVRQLRRFGVDWSAVEPALRFELDRSADGHPVTIGHADGLVTLDVAEADPVVREESRMSLGEPYRTPLGHVRHESGHWHWQAYVAVDEGRLARFRQLFGDEREGYAAALERHYDRAEDGSWMEAYISHYASAHPWEDYAESFAQALHLSDTLETGRAFALIDAAGTDFSAVYGQWTELAVALNELSRSMGAPDPAPFAPRARAVEKIAFAHRVLTGSA
jgi:hypothetical protein